MAARWKAVTGVAAVGLLLGGCAGGSGDTTTTGETGAALAVGAGLESSGVAGTGTLEELNPSQQLFLWQAEVELTRRCMEKAGFDYALPSRTADDFTANFRTADQLEAGGYNLEEKTDPGKSPNDVILKKLSAEKREEWNSTLFGGIVKGENTISMRASDGTITETSRDGCLSVAKKEIYGSLEGYMSLSAMRGDLTGSGVDNKLWADAKYQQVAVKWRSCMKSQGVDPGEHSVYGGQLVEQAYTDSPSGVAAAEKKITAADIICMRKTGIDTLRAETLERLKAETVKENGLNVAGANAFQQAALVRARKLVTR